VTDYKARILTALIETNAERAANPARRTVARRPRRRVAIVAVGCGAIAVAGLLVGRSRDTGIDVVSKAAAAISPRSGEILHYRLDGVRIVSPYAEVWQVTDPPLRYRNRAQGSTRVGSPCVFEFSGVVLGAGRIEVRSQWNPETATVYRGRGIAFPPGAIVWPDPFAQLQKHLAEGDLRESGRKMIDGRQTILLTPRDPTRLPSDGRFGDLTRESAYYVDASTYMPVRWVVSRTYRQHYDVSIFEYLPVDPANLALVSVAGAHPGSRITGASPPSRDCGAG
jgi:hypothetical protein